jgi:signal transduction histidine kinase
MALVGNSLDQESSADEQRYSKMRDFLRKVDLFAELPEEDLNAICGSVTEVRLKDNELLFAEGDRGHRAFIIEEGQLEIIKKTGEREVLLAVRQVGDVIGEMALLEEAPRMASVRARGSAKLLTISKETLDNLLATSASAAWAMLKTVLNRWRGTQAQLRQSEQMAQLGTLTAGVAHELNNPAAAVKRGADQMMLALTPFSETQAALSRFEFSPEQQAKIGELKTLTQTRTAEDNVLDALERNDQEGELEDWLYDAEIEDPWDIAPTLVDLGLTTEDLAALRHEFSADELDSILRWAIATHQAHSLLREIGQGAGRISEIVKALKSYAYLDQAPVQPVDIHEDLNNTLIILRHKLKQGIEVKRDYAPSLPMVEAYGSELNQVWTNILDNAVDALEGEGVITLRTRSEDDWVVVEIQDDGPGIPEKIRTRIFDAFFTTKPPGKGTGLGLNISYNIVVYKHRGDIRVYSKPGFTCFQIWLPVNFTDANTSPVKESTPDEHS